MECNGRESNARQEIFSVRGRGWRTNVLHWRVRWQRHATYGRGVRLRVESMGPNPLDARGQIERGRSRSQQEDLHCGGLGRSELSFGRGLWCRHRRMETNREPPTTHDRRALLLHQSSEPEQRPQAAPTKEFQRTPMQYYVILQDVTGLTIELNSRKILASKAKSNWRISWCVFQ